MQSYSPAGKLMLIWQDLKVVRLNKSAKNCCCEFGTGGILGFHLTSITFRFDVKTQNYNRCFCYFTATIFLCLSREMHSKFPFAPPTGIPGICGRTESAARLLRNSVWLMNPPASSPTDSDLGNVRTKTRKLVETQDRKTKRTTMLGNAINISDKIGVSVLEKLLKFMSIV